MISYKKSWIILFSFLQICNALNVPADEPSKEVAGDEKEDSVKAIPFALPSFLSSGKPNPQVFGNTSVNGEITGLYAMNNNTLISQSGPNSTAIASLNSSSLYFAQPYNESMGNVDGGWTDNTNLAGLYVTAQEDVHAYAEGDLIQFINHGASYANGWGESAVNGGTINSDQPSSSGWKAPSKPLAGKQKRSLP